MIFLMKSFTMVGGQIRDADIFPDEGGELLEVDLILLVVFNFQLKFGNLFL